MGWKLAHADASVARCCGCVDASAAGFSAKHTNTVRVAETSTEFMTADMEKPITKLNTAASAAMSVRLGLDAMARYTRPAPVAVCSQG